MVSDKNIFNPWGEAIFLHNLYDCDKGPTVDTSNQIYKS